MDPLSELPGLVCLCHKSLNELSTAVHLNGGV